MRQFLGLIVRALVGILSIFVAILFLDQIHDRNTEIIVACIGLSYSGMFIMSRRWQYYGLNAVSLFGMTVSWINAEPFDASLRGSLNLPVSRSLAGISIFFAVVIELVCVYRLFTSLVGHGWDRFAVPVHSALALPAFQLLLTWLDTWK